MAITDVGTKLDQIFVKACRIQAGKAKGLWLPKMWHLALRKHLSGMEWLANWLADKHGLGRPQDGYGAFGLCRRAYRAGSSTAPQNLAMDHFNRNDLAGYRHWLRRAARAGDCNAAIELRHFETRLPHGSAGKIGRIRPLRKSEK